MSIIVAKFGGSSLADAGMFRKVREILRLDDRRRYVIPSAPGKRFEGDEKVTDMLYACHALAAEGKPFNVLFDRIAQRYLEIAAELSLSLPLAQVLEEVRSGIAQSDCADYAASRGEYLNGLLLADYLGWDFVDPQRGIFFNEKGRLDAEHTQEVFSALLLSHPQAVIPGFYGCMPDGRVRTFSRGGSDITGSIVARAVAAELYENWTDVPGCLAADPRIVDHPLSIDQLTYRELRELSYMGASVLHEDALFPVRRSGIPTNIRDTNDPGHPGTMITFRPSPGAKERPITGIAGRKDFVVVSIEKAMMNSELGFGRRVLQVFESLCISFEHLPTGIDTMCVVCSKQQLEGKREELIHDLWDVTDPDSVEVLEDMALVATVGRGMVRSRGTSARLFSALHKAHINVRMIDQGSSELNIIVGVNNDDFENAVRAIYDAFLKDEK